ncbi:MAG: hypothetical protein AB7I19_10825 [Planctomycetota bacterium]
MLTARHQPRTAAALALVAMVLRLLLPLLHEHGHGHGHAHAHAPAQADGRVEATGACPSHVAAFDGDAEITDHDHCSACEFVGQNPGAPPMPSEWPCLVPWLDVAERRAVASAERWLACTRPPSRAPPSLWS